MTSHISNTPGAQPRADYQFSVEAERDPGALMRVLEVSAKRNYVPEQVYASALTVRSNRYAIDFRLTGITAHEAEVIAETVRAITTVCVVLKSQITTSRNQLAV